MFHLLEDLLIKSLIYIWPERCLYTLSEKWICQSMYLRSKITAYTSHQQAIVSSANGLGNSFFLIVEGRSNAFSSLVICTLNYCIDPGQHHWKEWDYRSEGSGSDRHGLEIDRNTHLMKQSHQSLWKYFILVTQWRVHRTLYFQETVTGPAGSTNSAVSHAPKPSPNLEILDKNIEDAIIWDVIISLCKALVFESSAPNQSSNPHLLWLRSDGQHDLVM